LWLPQLSQLPFFCWRQQLQGWMGGHVSTNGQHLAGETTPGSNAQKVDVLEFCCLRRESDDGLEPAMKADIMDFVLAESNSNPNLRRSFSMGDCSPTKSPKSPWSRSSTTCSSDTGSALTSVLHREAMLQTDSSTSSRSEQCQNGVVLGCLRSRGCTYEGELANGLEHGDGMLRWDDGRSYRGQFADGRFNGLGEMSWPDGRRYVGEYHQDRKHGLGTFTWQDGRRYAGEWSHGKKHGFGAYKNAKGRTCQGVWNADQPVTMERGQNLEQEQRHIDMQLKMHALLLRQERHQQQQQQQQQEQQQRSRSATPTKKKSSFLLKPQRPPSPLDPGQDQNGLSPDVEAVPRNWPIMPPE